MGSDRGPAVVRPVPVTAPARAAARPGAGDAGPPALADSLAELRESLRGLLAALLEKGYGIALAAVERMADGLDEMAARGGLQPGALLGGLTAKLTGGNPIVGALTGAFRALSPGAKALLVLALVLAVVLLPVTVVLLLLVLIVGALVLWARSG
jgi:hypothetical protein